MILPGLAGYETRRRLVPANVPTLSYICSIYSGEVRGGELDPKTRRILYVPISIPGDEIEVCGSVGRHLCGEGKRKPSGETCEIRHRHRSAHKWRTRWALQDDPYLMIIDHQLACDI